MNTLTEKFVKDMDKYWVGFDKLMENHRDVHKSINSSFPPYNIVKKGDNEYLIEIALAGYGKSEINVEFKENDNTLSISSSVEKTSDDENYIVHGIAKRWFERTFKLADNVEVKNAEMINGMLKVWLDAAEKTSTAIKKIDIS